eukprot:336903_1
MVNLSAWVVSGCLWLIPFLLITIAYSYYFYTLYLLFRRHKFGCITAGKVIKKWVTVSSNDTHKTMEYYLRYTFDDKRQEINDMYLDCVMNKFISSTYLHIPSDIVNLCTQYIGNSLTFYHGPFHCEEHVSNLTYDDVCEGDPINIKYDPKYPHNVQIHDGHTNALDKCCIWSVVFLCICAVFIGIVCGLKVSIEYNHARSKSILLIICIPSIILTILVLMLCSFKKRVFCFRDNLENKLRFVNDLHDDMMETSPSLCTDVYTIPPSTMVNRTNDDDGMESSETSVDDEMSLTEITLTHHHCAVQKETKINILHVNDIDLS